MSLEDFLADPLGLSVDATFKLRIAPACMRISIAPRGPPVREGIAFSAGWFMV